MRELRPTCEHCNKALPPDSLEARICSYECTFCVACVEHVLGNVCQNCGDFVPRPIRPSTNWQFSGERSGEHQGEAPAGGSGHAYGVLVYDQGDPAAETLEAERAPEPLTPSIP
jgi:hypothetical protein